MIEIQPKMAARCGLCASGHAPVWHEDARRGPPLPGFYHRRKYASPPVQVVTFAPCDALRPAEGRIKVVMTD
jgi:hypothetical protein